ncbi:TetR/AcrR family transcriptional regulator [Arthrobacter sp. ATA002]|uniref:TetR/AcrR family transcriptional regulator n=1 Tax=Arthrobacter sp. ATA002 TaxID=2991715 RepID=UPI0022A7D861|nr:TetR/AcrR family transcriptional regulator [Arthrobacter sp. ATA002]WAP50461.1 TetR/AcrR family transcriptional regulator [Arthrobacter sp. ATA002]
MNPRPDPDRSVLSAAAIAACGLELADREGLEAVSMRNVADVLGVSAMALYRHVENRDALLLAMAAEAARDFVLVPQSPCSWKEMLQHMAVAQWDGFQQHPWLLQIVLGPSRLLDMAPTKDLEVLLQALQATGLPEDDCFDCVLGISGIVIGTAVLALAANPGPGRYRPTRPNAVVPLDADDGAAPGSLTAAFRGRGITYDASRRSLDFAVESFLLGIEDRITASIRMRHDKHSGLEKEQQ